MVGPTELESVTSCVSSRNHGPPPIHFKGLTVSHEPRTPAKLRVFDTNLTLTGSWGGSRTNEQRTKASDEGGNLHVVLFQGSRSGHPKPTAAAPAAVASPRLGDHLRIPRSRIRQLGGSPPFSFGACFKMPAPGSLTCYCSRRWTSLLGRAGWPHQSTLNSSRAMASAGLRGEK
jgi:hypothetical protein